MSETYSTIIICTGGKTGSSTLVDNMILYRDSCLPNVRVIGEGAERHGSDVVQYCSRVATKQHRVLVLTSFREPVSRMISSMFQNLNKHIPGIWEQPIENQIKACWSYMDKCLHPSTVNYFEAYHPMSFPPCQIHDFFFQKTPTVDTMWLRLDQASNWEKQISTALPGFTLVPSNVSEYKHYTGLYKTFKATYWNPYVKDLMDHERPIWRYYMTEEEAQKITEYWSAPR